MTNLTEQWKKGELPNGHYYYTTIFSPTVHIQNFTRDVMNFQDFKETVCEVLAPVPNYEEWKSSDKLILTLMDNIKDKSDLLQRAMVKNVELKELLKKHRDTLARTLALCIDLNFGEKQKNKFADDIAEIDQVLGEE